MAGLALALGLLRRGFKVSVYEKVPDLKELGAGFMCSPNGTKVLYALGLKSQIEEIEVRLADRYVRLWNTGDAWQLPGHGEGSEERYGAPFLVLHRGDLHSILIRAVRHFGADIIHAGASCLGFSQDAERVELHLGDGRRIEGDALIGADGIHSAVRKQLFGDASARFTGQVAWRGLIPSDRLPEHLRGRFSANWIGPRGVVTMYPVRRGELLNFASAVRRDEWRLESWTEPGSTPECLADFPGWHEDIRELIQRIDTPFKHAIFERAPLPRWSVGRVTLMGDAAHSMPPYFGQGLNMALEDAIVLARTLDAVADPVAALKRYEQLRLERANRVVDMSLEQGRRIQNPALADTASARAYIEANWKPEKVEGRYDWIFAYDAGREPT